MVIVAYLEDIGGDIMKGDKKKQMKKTIKQAIKEKKKAKWVIPTKDEVEKDRKEHIEMRTVTIIKESDVMVSQLRNLQYHKAVIQYRQMMFKKHESDTEKYIFLEDFDGRRVIRPVLLTEQAISYFAHHTILRDYTRLREKFEKVYEFTEEEVLKILNQEFDFVDWQKRKVENDYAKDKTEREKDNTKPETVETKKG